MISSPGVGGREIDVPVLARKLIAQGHPTWVMCRPGTLVEQLSQAWNLPVVATGMRGYFDPLDIWSLARFLKREKIQIIHAHWSRDLANLILASRLAGRIPVVLTKHVYSTEKKLDLFHAWVYRNTDHVIAISHLVEKNLLKTVPLPGEKVTTIYNGIELQTYWNPELTRNCDLRGDYGVPPGKPILGYVGRLNQGKRPHLVVEAFVRLAPAFPEWHLVMVGKPVGPTETAYAEKLKATVRAAGFEDRVHWVGFRKDMPAVMQSFAVLACASAFESLGMVAVEAMAMERPVVGPAAGGIPEIIADGRSGYLFQPGDAADLERKLRNLLTAPERRQDMGRVGREIVFERFNLDKMAEQVASIFHEVLRAGRPSRT